MDFKSAKLWQIYSAIATVVVACLIVAIILVNKGEETSSMVKENEEEESKTQIVLNEDLILTGTVENLNNVNFYYGRMLYQDKKAIAYIMLNNESDTEKVSPRTVTVELLNKQGKVIAKNDAQMGEISNDMGQTELMAEFDMAEPQIIYDLRITAKAENESTQGKTEEEPKVEENKNTVEEQKTEE